jgi:RimJ/RimL family protein N-acetyltransferase
VAIGILFECDEKVAEWLFDDLRKPIYKYDRALGLLNSSGILVGAILYQNWNGPNVELSYYGKNTLTLGIVRCIARFTLTAFNPARLTVITSKRNRQFMKALQKLGFRLEGIQRCYYGTRDCNRNTGVRFVAFRDAIERVAKITETVQQCL